jgi:hypothetical protein
MFSPWSGVQDKLQIPKMNEVCYFVFVVMVAGGTMILDP